MIKLSKLKKIDSQKMYEIYDQWPEIAQNSYESNLTPVDFKNINQIIFAGMGGSGSLGDVFSSILSKSKIHVSVVKGYLLPETVDNKSLIVTTSISGNTIETLNILQTAFRKKLKIIAVSSGGKIEKFCEKNEIEYRKIEEMHSPRASFSIFLYGMLKVLNPIIPITKNDIIQSIRQMRLTKKKISSENLTKNNDAMILAEWVSGIPLIYYPFGLMSTAIRFKNSLQENAKQHAMTENVIEACHNGIVSWEKSSIVQPILLRGADDHLTTKKRWEILKNYFNENEIDFKEIKSVNGSILAKTINLIYLLDYSSIFRAILRGIDPSPIRSIEYIKKKL